MTSLCAQDSWSLIPPATTANLWGACYGNGQFVAVGERGTIVTSPDGVIWTARTSGTNAWLTSVGYGLEQYIAVGGEGTILLSRDAISWENLGARRSNLTTTRLNVVTFQSDGFVIYGEDNRAVTLALPPRIDEPSRPPITGRWWRGSASGLDRNVLGGAAGLAAFRLSDPFLVDPQPGNVPSGVREINGIVFDQGAFAAVGAAGYRADLERRHQLDPGVFSHDPQP